MYKSHVYRVELKGYFTTGPVICAGKLTLVSLCCSYKPQSRSARILVHIETRIHNNSDIITYSVIHIIHTYMDVSRISKTIFIWGMEQFSAKCRSHFYGVHQFLIIVDMEYVYCAQDANTRSILCSFGHELSQLQPTQWTDNINAPIAVRGEIVWW